MTKSTKQTVIIISSYMSYWCWEDIRTNKRVEIKSERVIKYRIKRYSQLKIKEEKLRVVFADNSPKVIPSEVT